MDNLLAPGAAGLPAPSPQDAKANRLVPSLPPPSPMMKEFGSQLDAAEAKFGQVQEAQARVAATRRAWDQLLALQDTLTTEDVVDACAEIVAAGVPAVDVAGMLADMPTQPQPLQAWVAENAEGIAEMEQQVGEAMKAAQFELGVVAFGNLLAASAETHSARTRAVPGTRSIN